MVICLCSCSFENFQSNFVPINNEMQSCLNDFLFLQIHCACKFQDVNLKELSRSFEERDFLQTTF